MIAWGGRGQVAAKNPPRTAAAGACWVQGELKLGWGRWGAVYRERLQHPQALGKTKQSKAGAPSAEQLLKLLHSVTVKT